MKLVFLVAITGGCMLIASSISAQSQGKLVGSPYELPEMGVLRSKTLCVVISKDDQAPKARTEICGSVKQITRRTFMGDQARSFQIEIGWSYQPFGAPAAVRYLSEITYYVGELGHGAGWSAIIRTEDAKGIGFLRSVHIDELRIF